MNYTQAKQLIKSGRVGKRHKVSRVFTNQRWAIVSNIDLRTLVELTHDKFAEPTAQQLGRLFRDLEQMIDLTNEVYNEQV